MTNNLKNKTDFRKKIFIFAKLITLLSTNNKIDFRL